MCLGGYSLSSHSEIERGLTTLHLQALGPDYLFDLLPENWAMQVLACLSRATSDAAPAAEPIRGKLTTTSRPRLDEHISDRLDAPTRLKDLALVAKLGSRQLIRAFQVSFAATLLQYVTSLHLEEAKRQLVGSEASITDIALSCDFSHAQHFSNAFSKAIGICPSEDRRS